jgi:hypothetical protein
LSSTSNVAFVPQVDSQYFFDFHGNSSKNVCGFSVNIAALDSEIALAIPTTDGSMIEFISGRYKTQSSELEISTIFEQTPSTLVLGSTLQKFANVGMP